jgi:selenocysteine-specific elongation factor
LVALVDAHHARAPLDDGAPLQSVRAKLAAHPALVDLVLEEEARAGTLEIAGSMVLRRGWKPTLTPEQERVRDALLDALRNAGREPPSVSELTARFGADAPALLRLLERGGDVVQVEGDRYYARAVVDEMLAALRGGMQWGREYGPAELREFLGFSRKYLIPFLEYCDKNGLTERRAGGRVLAAR